MRNRWLAVVRDGILIGLLVYLVRYIPALFEYPGYFPFIYGVAILGALTTLFATVGFCISGCFSPNRRRWHLPRVLGFVWLSGVIAVFPNPGGHYFTWSVIYWLLGIVPLGMAMLFGGALSYWFVKEQAESPPDGDPNTVDRPEHRFTGIQLGGGIFTLQNLLILICAESSLILVASTIYDHFQERSIGSNDSIGSDFSFAIFVIFFLFALPLRNFHLTTEYGLDDRTKYSINRVVAGLTIAFAAVLLNILIALNEFWPSLGMVVGPLLAIVALVVIGMGVLNIVIGLFNNPRKGQSSG